MILLWFKYFPPKENSKRQQALLKNPRKETVLGCNNCHITDTTLIKAKDSYYCIKCFKKLNKERG